LYGTLDGAMKFVQGDVISGLIRTTRKRIKGFIIKIIKKGIDVNKGLKSH
jgi:type III secretory pathway component EscV